MWTKLTIICLFMFLYVSASFAYTPPVGIPAPTWGIDDVMPGRPEVWTSEVAGYYFIDRKSASKAVYGGDNCTNTSNTYGYLGHPRCDIPSTIKKGSRIEIYGEHDAQTTWTNDGTNPPNGNAWSANTDGPAWVTMPNIEGTAHFFSAKFTSSTISYLYFDGIYSKRKAEIGGAADHIMIRNSEFDLSTFVDLSAWATIGSVGTAEATNNNIIIYKNTIKNIGNMSYTGDADNIGIMLGNYTTYGWALENTFSQMSASSIGIGGQATIDLQYQHHLYVGKNTITDGNGFGVWSKNSTDAVFSENVISDIHDFPRANTGGPTYGNCMGGQYGLNRVWYINNKCSATTSGARFGGVDAANDFKVFIIGNTIYDIGLDYLGSEYTVAYNAETAYVEGNTVSYEGEYYIAKGNTTGNLPTNTTYWSVLFPSGADRIGSGIVYYGSGDVWVVNNTMYDIPIGMLAGSGSNVYFENNIVSTINESDGYYFWHKFELSTETIVVKNNNFYGTNTKFRIYTTEYTDLADFIADTDYGDGSISTDPSFVSAPTNLRLNSGSGARGTGLAAADLSNVTIGETTYTDVYAAFLGLYGIDIKKDIAGTTRPQETTWDMGAYEYDPATVRSAMSIGAGAGVSIGSGATMTLY